MASTARPRPASAEPVFGHATCRHALACPAPTSMRRMTGRCRWQFCWWSKTTCRWTLRCLQGDTKLRVCGNIWIMLSITEIVTEIRSRFDGRRSGPSGSMEVPPTWQEWCSFVSLWLFGPPAHKQATPVKWLRCRPASDTRELCHECGKTSAPEMKQIGRAHV